MSSIEADYINGVLKPVEPLELNPGERVRLVVVRKSDATRWDPSRLGAHADEDVALAEAGLGQWADALDALDGQ